MRPSEESLEIAKQRLAIWLRQGISPQRLALTLALGFVIGCIPVIGIPTAVCGLVAVAFRLNQPAIQVANYLAMPFQLLLIVPFVRLGNKITPFSSALDLGTLARSPFQMLTHSSTQLVTQFGMMAGQALLAWLLLAVPVVLLLTATLTPVLRRMPAFFAPEPRQ